MHINTLKLGLRSTLKMGKHSHELGRDAPATRLVPGCRFSWGVQDGKGCRYRRGLCVHKNIMIRRRKITESNK